MSKRRAHSAGLILYRNDTAGRRVLLAHPGGPLWARRDVGAWSIPKGLVNPGENIIDAAVREFEEELGWKPVGEAIPIGKVILRSGKLVTGFAMESAEAETAILDRFSPGLFTMDWPPRTGRTATFPEVDRVEFFSIDDARQKVNPAQAALIDRVAALP